MIYYSNGFSLKTISDPKELLPAAANKKGTQQTFKL